SWLHLCRLPAAAEGLVERNQAHDEAPFALHLLVLSGVQRTLVVEHGQEVGEAPNVELAGQGERDLTGVDGLCEPLLARMLLTVGAQRILGVLGRAENRLLVAREGCLLARFLNANIRADATAGEDRPDHLGPDRGESARASEHIRRIDGGNPERAAQ